MGSWPSGYRWLNNGDTDGMEDGRKQAEVSVTSFVTLCNSTFFNEHILVAVLDMCSVLTVLCLPSLIGTRTGVFRNTSKQFPQVVGIIIRFDRDLDCQAAPVDSRFIIDAERSALSNHHHLHTPTNQTTS